MPGEPRCVCPCHYGVVIEWDRRGARSRADGVDLRNPIDAATACSKCQPRHAVALLSVRDANAPMPRIVEPWVDMQQSTNTAEGDAGN